MRLLGATLTTIAILVGPAAGFAQECVRPGTIVTMPRPAILTGSDPALVVVFPKTRTRVRVLESSGDELRFQMPFTDVPAGASFSVFNVSALQHAPTPVNPQPTAVIAPSVPAPVRPKVRPAPDETRLIQQALDLLGSSDSDPGNSGSSGSGSGSGLDTGNGKEGGSGDFDFGGGFDGSDSGFGSDSGDSGSGDSGSDGGSDSGDDGGSDNGDDGGSGSDSGDDSDSGSGGGGDGSGDDGDGDSGNSGSGGGSGSGDDGDSDNGDDDGKDKGDQQDGKEQENDSGSEKSANAGWMAPSSPDRTTELGSRILMANAPLRLVTFATDVGFGDDLVRVRAALPSVQLLAGGRICEDEISMADAVQDDNGMRPQTGQMDRPAEVTASDPVGSVVAADDATATDAATQSAVTRLDSPADGVSPNFGGPVPGADAVAAVYTATWTNPLPMPNDPPSEEELLASLGLGEGGQQDAYRATEDVFPAPSDTPQFVMVVSKEELAAALAIIQSVGGTALEASSLSGLGLEMIIVDLAGGISGDEVRALLAFDRVDADFDMNHVYEGAQGRRSYAHKLVGFSPFESCILPRSVRIGIVDGPIDYNSPYLRNIRMRSHSVLSQREIPASTSHATGIASLIAATPDGDNAGLALGAELLAAVAFADSKKGNIASTGNLVKAIDWLLNEQVEIINLSLTGPYNRTLNRVFSIAADRGAIIVAAAGNDGRPQVAYPGSDPNVIAVTAVDAFRDLYAQASFGDQVEFAAPGVDLLVAEGDGLAYRSGTSYAAAVASALIAHVIGDDELTSASVRDVLRDNAMDLGAKGWDPRFGWGLMQMSQCASATHAGR